MWCVPRIDAAFVRCMEDVLRLYARPLRRNEPVIVLDERPVVLRDVARRGRAARPGSVGRRDYEYIRRGTANIFCILEPLTGRRLTYASADRKGPAFAKALQRIARRYRRAKRIHLVMDNLSTHARSCVINALGAIAARACGAASRCTTRRSTRVGSTSLRWKQAWCPASAWQSGASAT